MPSKALQTAEVDARGKSPHTTIRVDEATSSEEVLRVTEAKDLHHHVHMLCESHLRLYASIITHHVTNDTRLTFAREAIWEIRFHFTTGRRSTAIEENL